MTKIIIGLIGQNGAGKTTITNYLKKKYQAAAFRFSDPLKDILDRLHLDNSRQNYQTLSTILRENFSEDILSKTLAEDVKNSQANLIIAEGVRRPTDITYLKDLPGFHLIAVQAEQKIRFHRIKNRNEKAGDQNKSWEKFLAEDNQEAESKIQEITAQAELIIDNNGSLKNLYEQLDDLIKKYS